MFKVANCDLKRRTWTALEIQVLCIHGKRIKCAKRRIVLIDNYVDETVLTLHDKRGAEVSAVIYTQQIGRQFQLDIERHNAQYAPVEVNTFRLSHDRFLCIDDDVYHIGASIKDLGKKWFGFSKMEILTPNELVTRINRE